MKFPACILICLLHIVLGADDTLKVVHLVFRHGEKVPDLQYTYPTDPHKNRSIGPYPPGCLKTVGKQTMYNLGKILRQRYQGFLGDIYSPIAVGAWSSGISRAQYSVQLVLASLFPPRKWQIWNENLDWQPVIYRFSPARQDKMLLGIMSREFHEEYQKVCMSEEVQKMYKKYQPEMEYIAKHSGFDANCTITMFALYMALEVEEEFGWELPKWTKTVYPALLKKLTYLEYKIQTYTNNLKSILIGNLMQKILEDTEKRINGKSKKIFNIYSGHDINVVHTLSVLGFYYPHIPNYAACIAIEVHKVENKYVLKVFYKARNDTDFILRKDNHGRNNITLEDFRTMVQEISNPEPHTHSSSSVFQVRKYLYAVAVLMCLSIILTVNQN